MVINAMRAESPLIMLIADGVHNSVFVSQVVEPLKKRAAGRPLVLISFERPMPITVPAELHELDCELILLPRLPFISTISLIPSLVRLRKILQQYPSYEMIARGPFAGWLGLHAINQNCSTLTIQARGLVAEEYKMIHSSSPSLLSSFRARQFVCLERTVYSTRKAHVIIEAVSEAMREYLCKEFCADRPRITIAEIDKPMVVAEEQRNGWRAQVRAELNIPKDAHVWCYSGSAKAWQCPEETVQYLSKKLQENSNHFALVLSPDVKIFEKLFDQFRANKSRYRVLKTSAADTFKYLAAADAGIVFRAASPVNWVSRPTKVLEYRALGLTVIHNDTIAWLTNDKRPGQSGL